MDAIVKGEYPLAIDLPEGRATLVLGSAAAGSPRYELDGKPVVWCHFCADAHTDWTAGEVWQCGRCNFRLPAAHVWYWWPKDASEPMQLAMEL